MQTIPEQRLQQGRDDITALFNIVCPGSKIEFRMKPDAFIDTYLCRAVEPLVRRAADQSDDYMRSLLAVIAKNEEQNTESNRANPDYLHTLAEATGRLMQVEKYRMAFDNVTHSLHMKTRNPREDMERVRRSKRISNTDLIQRINEIGGALHIAANEGVKIQMTKENAPALYDFRVLAIFYRQSQLGMPRSVLRLEQR